MTIGELVFWYACIFLALLVALIALLLRQKSGAKKLSLQLDWRPVFVRFKENVPGSDSWLKIFVAGFIALAAGVIIANLYLALRDRSGLGGTDDNCGGAGFLRAPAACLRRVHSTSARGRHPEQQPIVVGIGARLWLSQIFECQSIFLLPG